MNQGYNRYYKIMSEHYEENIFVVLKRFDKVGSHLYKIKNMVEAQALKPILELIGSDNLQVVITNDPVAYGEYGPYTPVDDLRELIMLAMNN